MDFNLFGLQNSGFLTNSSNLNNHKQGSRNTLCPCSYLHNSWDSWSCQPAPSPTAKPFITSVVLAHCKAVKKGWSKTSRECRTQRKNETWGNWFRALFTVLFSTFTLVPSRPAHLWRNREHFDTLRRQKKKEMVTSGCSFYLGCKSEYNT